MPDTLAARTREAARDHPFLVTALRADVVNYAAAARFLDVADDVESVATALRRFADDLPDYAEAGRDALVTMQSGVGPAPPDADPLLVVGDASLAADDGSLTAVLATGEVDAAALHAALGHLLGAGVDPVAAGVGDGTLVVVVERRAGARALRAVEDALDAVPATGSEL